MKNIKKILTTKNTVLIVFVLVLAICFEAAQQLFYLKRFNLAENAQYLELLKNQSYRWIVWFVLGFFLVFKVEKDVEKEYSKTLITRYLFTILILVIVNVFIISFIALLINGDHFQLDTFFSDYILFFVFQKSPIYILGYIAITIILFLSYKKEQLEVKVDELIALKLENEKEYNRLKEANSDKTKVLNIKIGNKRKIIPINTITWLEADDYCVIVHTQQNAPYTMRETLKSLENKLGDNFLRVHRKSIVNMNMVKEFKVNTNPKLTLVNKEEVQVSKSNLKKVKTFLNS